MRDGDGIFDPLPSEAPPGAAGSGGGAPPWAPILPVPAATVVKRDADPDASSDGDGAEDLAKIQTVAHRLAALPDPILDQRLGAEAVALGIGKRTLRMEVVKARARMAAGQAEPCDEPKDSRGRADLEVRSADLPDTAVALAVLLTKRPMLFDRGGPARLAFDAQRGGETVELLTINGVVNECHEVARPFRWRSIGNGLVDRENITLPDRVAKLYLDRKGRSGLRPLDGIASAPLLAPDGSIRTVAGYDATTRLWCENMPAVDVPERPTGHDAKTALLCLRTAFRTFPYADAQKVHHSELGVDVVALTKPPGEDDRRRLPAS